MSSRWNVARCRAWWCAVAIALGPASLACDESRAASIATGSSAPYQDLSARELKAMMDRGDQLNIVDVRTAREYAAGHIPGAVSIPHRQLSYRYTELDLEKSTVLYCNVGATSAVAALQLSRLAETDLYSLSGGLSAWPYALVAGNGRRLF